VRDMRLTITSGGQTGADQGALRAAWSRGVPTGGWAPARWVTEAGPAPWLGEVYGLRECPEPGYTARTLANVRDADALLWFGNPYSPGGRLTLGLLADCHIIPHFVVIHTSTPADVADWLTGTVFPGEEEVRLLVAGNRESGSPGIGERVESFVRGVLDLLAGTVEIDSCPTPPAPVE
jgi:hypothetical protein